MVKKVSSKVKREMKKVVKKEVKRAVNKMVRTKRIRKAPVKRTRSTVVYHSTKEIKVEQALIENFIGLQRVLVNISTKFDNLSNQISKLLELFEISAKSLAKKELTETGNIEAKDIMERLDDIARQAGLIGRGLALIHEVGSESGRPMIPLNPPMNNPEMEPQNFQMQMPNTFRPLPTSANPMQSGDQDVPKGLAGFQRSVNTDEKPEGSSASAG